MVMGHELRIQQPKTKRVKVVPLTQRSLRILQKRLQVSRPYLLGQPNGGPWSLPWIDRRWFQTLRKAGLSGIRFHDLRHTFATRLAQQGVDPTVVGELLGHKPPYTMTMRYFHPLPEAKREAIRRLASL
jgi:integrase